ncbi:MAG: sodium:proton antiporter [Streptosporangiaceae bacterium]
MINEQVGPLPIVVLLMFATVLLVGVGERIRRPFPVLVTLLGVALAFIPGLPTLVIEPDLILPLFLPPLIYAAAQRTSWRMLQARKRVIFWLAGVLVVITVLAVAGTAHLIVPGVSAGAALALGALVAPPDPVAAEAVAGPLRLPRRLMSVLQTEGLCNDATALVIYGVAVTSMSTGHISVPGVVARFGWEVVAALALGLLVGYVATFLQARIRDRTARNALTLVIPFASYLLADSVHASGVLAVLVVGLYVGQRADEEARVGDRLAETAFWDTLEMLITGLAFGMIGMAMRTVVPALDQFGTLALHALVICLVIIVIRVLWLLESGRIVRGDPDRDSTAQDWREDLVLAACGMRGLATLALALALPLDTPARNELLFIAFSVLVVTMILPGLLLPTLVRVLGVQAETDAEEAAERAIAYRAAKASMARLRELEEQEDLPARLVETLAAQQRGLLDSLCTEKIPQDAREDFATRRKQAREARRIYAEMLAASRREVLQARTEPGVDPTAVDRVLHRLDLRSARLL